MIDWTMLTTYSGALSMVLIITQITKDVGWIKKIPTQLWSYLISLAVLYMAYFFTGSLTISTTALILFQGMIVSLSANGGFEVLEKKFPEFFVKK